ncbi:MAG: hypothetical protein IJ244_03400, partial [Bacteroidaceae bacterium]|nr:hypothetical protein [Bacteroidaceae bacterium]
GNAKIALGKWAELFGNAKIALGKWAEPFGNAKIALGKWTGPFGNAKIALGKWAEPFGIMKNPPKKISKKPLILSHYLIHFLLTAERDIFRKEQKSSPSASEMRSFCKNDAAIIWQD